MLALHTLPTEWGAVTLHQAAQLAALGEGATIQDCLAVLAECAPEELLHLSPQALNQALASVLFLAEPIPTREVWPRPTSIHLGGSIASVEVPVLDTLEDLSFGQAADIGGLMQEHAADVAQLRLKVLATILQPAYDGTAYDSDRVAVVEVLCADIKLRDAIPLTDFFLPSTTGSGEPTPPTSNTSLLAERSPLPTSGASVLSGIP